MRWIAPLLVLTLSAGCTIQREYQVGGFRAEQLEALRAARTKKEVLERVGPPDDVGLQLDGSVFVYRTRLEEAGALSLSAFQASFDYETTERRTARVLVLFDKQGNKIGQGFDPADPEED